jgi:hypothetical protein
MRRIRHSYRRLADTLYRRGIDPELVCNLPHPRAPRLTQRCPYGVRRRLRQSRAPKPRPLSFGPRKPGTDTFLYHWAARQPHLRSIRDRDRHRCLPVRAAITAEIVAASTAPLIRNRAPLARRKTLRCCGRDTYWRRDFFGSAGARLAANRG